MKNQVFRPIKKIISNILWLIIIPVGTVIQAIELDFNNSIQKAIYDRVVEATRTIYQINDELAKQPAKRISNTLQKQKETLISEIQELIARVYRLEF